MQKKEWIVSLCILCVLALCAAGATGFVLRQNRPDAVAAFEGRFLNLDHMNISASDGMTVSVADTFLSASWESAEEQLMLQTAVQPLPKGCSAWKLDLSGGGKQNTINHDQWGYQVWLELRLIDGDTVAAADRIEMPLEAGRNDRTRTFTMSASAAKVDGWQLAAIVTPLNGEVAEGSLILKNWEVWAK